MQQKTEFIIGTRESELAMIQARQVHSILSLKFPHLLFKISGFTTTGDQIQSVSLSKIGQKSLFTKELEIALEGEKVDLIVHSLKDLPTTLPPHMILSAVMERQDPRDAVVMSLNNSKSRLKTLPQGSVVGTSSVRRIAQMKRSFPHLEFQDIRGNLNTRLRKLDSENSPYACLLLAFAGIPLTHIGVHRMGWDSRITEILDKNEILYAVGQGALGIETREDDGITNEVVKVLQHFPTRVRCEAERAFMKALEGGCSVPLGVFTSFEDGILSLIGSVTSLDGQEQLRHEATVKVSGDEDEQIKSAHRLGNQVADVLKSQGAVEMLVAIRQQSAI